MISKAAALLYFIAKGHVCPDGNKRVAFILIGAFLDLNRHDLKDDYPEQAELIAEAISLPGDRREEALAMLTDWLNQAVVPQMGGTGTGGDE